MKKLQSLTSFLILLVWLAPLGLINTAFIEDTTALTAIANDKGAPATLSMKELKLVVQGDKQRWPDGTRISLAFMKTTTPAGNSTAEKLMNMSGDQFNKHWLALVFQGKAKAPMFFNSIQELDTYVSSTPGAIGIVEAGQTTKSRSLSVDEKQSF